MLIIIHSQTLFSLTFIQYMYIAINGYQKIALSRFANTNNNLHIKLEMCPNIIMILKFVNILIRRKNILCFWFPDQLSKKICQL